MNITKTASALGAYMRRARKWRDMPEPPPLYHVYERVAPDPTLAARVKKVVRKMEERLGYDKFSE